MCDMSADGYALTKHLETTPSAKRRDAERETGVARGDPCTPGTRGEGGLPRNPTRLGKDLSASPRGGRP